MNSLWLWLILCVVCVGLFSIIYLILDFAHVLNFFSVFDGGVIGVIITVIVSGLLAKLGDAYDEQ